MDAVTADLVWKEAGICIGAVCTLAMFSFLWRENKVYRFFEHVFVGLAVGYALGVTWTDVLKPNWWEKRVWVAQGDVASVGDLAGWWDSRIWFCKGEILPLWGLLGLVGLLWYFQLSPKRVWLSRIVMGILMGSGAGLVFQKIKAYFFGPNGQITQSFKPLMARTAEGRIDLLWDNLLVTVTLLVVLYYFIFWNRSRSRIGEFPSRLGRYLLMISFGAVFGSTVMARLSLLIERADYLINQWLRLGGP